MKLSEVKTKAQRRAFLDIARELYKDDPVWVCPLDNVIEGVFDPKKNVFFEHGEAIRWILHDDNGKLIGRVAAFINRKKAFGYEQPTGGMGFFECIDDQNAAFMLFDQCKNWLTERGMEAMDGPINFGENDNFWGLLVEGYTHPSFGMPYNHAYYEKFFVAYGFKEYFEQVTNHLDITIPFPERFWKIAEWVRKKPGFDWRHFEWKQSDKFIADLKEIYDEAWQHHQNFTPLALDTIKAEMAQTKAFLEEKFIWFVYHNEEPAAFLVMFPDVNQLLKPLKGKMNFWNKLRFFWLSKTQKIDRARITIMGVKPKFQRFGLESGIFWQMQQVMDQADFKHYREVELSWVGDFNPKMQAIHGAVGAKFGKRHRTFRLVFDPSDNTAQRHKRILYRN
ncbi:MAG: GNAT family N-acetyltransferase [Bacteroidales bacterium]|nr:GNAT family N-acetyltransferase [Bacteroidales bacterium]